MAADPALAFALDSLRTALKTIQECEARVEEQLAAQEEAEEEEEEEEEGTDGSGSDGAEEGAAAAAAAAAATSTAAMMMPAPVSAAAAGAASSSNGACVCWSLNQLVSRATDSSSHHTQPTHKHKKNRPPRQAPDRRGAQPPTHHPPQ